jgi:glucokinase
VFERYGVPCVIENDANAAGLAEVRFGAAKGCHSVLYATLGTGIGTGIILDGTIYHGKNGAAGEGGHVSIDYRSAAICNCGTPGCIEALASGTAVQARGIDPARMSDSALDELATMLGAWLGSVVNLLDPDMIVIGGGMSQIGDPLFTRIRREMPRRTINQFAASTPIVPAMLQQDCGIVGAATVALDLQSSRLHRP